MNANDMIRALEVNGGAMLRLLSGIEEHEMRWKESSERWSLLEILNHLVDEEREDFRRRLELTLADPAAKWPPIDPQGWVAARGYNDRDVRESLAAFNGERVRSLEFLGGLTRPDWLKTHQHANLGPLRAGDLLASWTAHDLLHIRQIAATRVVYIKRHAAPFRIDYAAP